jgi:hypothetical protein
MEEKADRLEGPGQRARVVGWLLDGDPSIRWQVMRDLLGAEDEAARERARIGAEGWGSALLARQRPDGLWGDGIAAPQWQSTLGALDLLRQMGLDPAGEPARRMADLVEDRVTWGPEFADAPFFAGEVEPCINGRVLAIGAYFGHGRGRLLDRLLNEQLADGGWNCEAERGSVRSSFHSTICVLEGLLGHERAAGTTPAVREALVRAQDYLLERRMLRRKSTGDVIEDRKSGHDWTRFTFPTGWRYDILRGLEALRTAGVKPDERTREAADSIAAGRLPDGRWPLHEPHRDPVGFTMENGSDEPSRWNTLRAMRVLEWHAEPTVA